MNHKMNWRKKIEAKGKGLYGSQWRTVQVRSHRTMAEMYHLRKRSITSQGNPQWILWCTHRHKGSSRQSNKTKILLANHKHRCKEAGSGM
jgi:hypothetical protein